MENQEVKQKLEELRKEVTKLGLEVLKSKIPINIDDVGRLLKPFANLENAIDREIRKFNQQKNI